MVQIITLSPDRWEEYKKLRIEAVTNNPPSFLSTPEETQSTNDNEWIGRLERSRFESSTEKTYFAEDNGKLIGMIGGYFEDKEKRRHIGHIVSFYVSPEYRGQGVGSQLMENIINWLESKPSIEFIQLGVYTTNPAIHLYKKFGFDIAGELKREIKLGDTYYDEYIMELNIK